MREGKRLAQPMADEIQQIIYAPRIAAERVDVFGPLCAVNMAHLVMLAEQAILAPAVVAPIARASLEIDAAGADAFTWDPGREDAYYNLEAQLVARTGIGVGGQIHAGRSRNDISATIDRMRVRDACIRIGAALCGVRQALLERAAEHAATVMTGYTHLQPAQPITYGFYLLGIAQALQRDGDRLLQAYERADHCPLGAGALAGTAFPIDRTRTADLLGFARVFEHAQDAVASRDFVIDAVHASVSVALTCSRFAQDLYVWSTREFGLIHLPDRVAGTSSIMPQKKNPIVLEHLKAKGAQAIGQMVSLLGAISGTHFTMTVDGCKASIASAWPLFHDTGDSLTLMRLVVEEARPVPRRMIDEATGNFSTATDLADALVTDHGLSFRQAHHVTGDAVARLVGDHLPAGALSERHLAAAAQSVLGAPLAVTADWVADRMDPRRAAQARTSRGGTGPAEVMRMIGEARDRLQHQSDVLEAARSAIADAAARRYDRVRQLAGADGGPGGDRHRAPAGGRE